MAFIHGDADNGRRNCLRSALRTKADCPLEIDIDSMQAFDHATGTPLAGAAYQNVLSGCRAVGATVEGSRAAGNKAEQATAAFLREVFAP